MKYFLLLSFLLALLPGSAGREYHAAKTKSFIAAGDLIPSLPASEHAKKADTESEDLHPINSINSDEPGLGEVIFLEIASNIDRISISFYSIRAPPIA